MVEPAACAVHAALSAGAYLSGATVVVLGAGTLGLCTLAALRAVSLPGHIIVGAKYPEQRELASALGATVVAQPEEVHRAVRRVTRSMEIGYAGGRLSDGADVVIDCVGSASSLAEALAIVRPRGRIVMVGMPGRVSVDLTPLWHREVELVGAYAYGTEGGRRTFDAALDLVAEADLGRLVSALYPIDRYAEALEHAANAGRRGAVKVAFDLRRTSRSR
jgi:threonine dehydrogenase-like Zn-dependent dehydrogenase